MKKILYALLMGSMALTSCNEKDEMLEQKELSENVQSVFQPEEIDWSVFDYLGEEAVAKLKAIAASNVNTRAIGYPGEIKSIEWNPSHTLLETFNPTLAITVTSEGIPETIDVYAYDYINDVECGRVTVTTVHTGGSSTLYTTTENLNINTFSSPDRYNVRAVTLMYEYTNAGNSQSGYLSMFYQQPTTDLFSIDLEAMNYGGVIPKEESPVAINRVGSFPNSLTQMVQFRARVGTTDVNTTVPAFIGVTQDSVHIHIAENNTNDHRKIIFEYSIIDGGIPGPWYKFDEAVQLSLTENIILQRASVAAVLPHASTYSFLLYGDVNVDITGTRFQLYTSRHNHYSDQYNADGRYYPHSTPSLATNLTGPQYTGTVDILVPEVGPAGYHTDYQQNIRRNYGLGAGAEWTLEYYNGNQWIDLFTFEQHNYYFGFSNEQRTLAQTGGVWNLKYAGIIPSGKVQVFAGLADGTPLSAVQTLSATGSNIRYNHITLSITSPNTSTVQRNIYLWYTIGSDELSAPSYATDLNNNGMYWRRWGDPLNTETSDWEPLPIPYVIQLPVTP